MGKLTFKGFVPKDDPMFTQGASMFTRPEVTRRAGVSTALSEEDRSLLHLIEASVQQCKGSGVSDPKALAGLIAAYLSGVAGDALDEEPITHFGKRMNEAIELLDSGTFPESLCIELERRWTS